jgi:hypothetical protein
MKGKNNGQSAGHHFPLVPLKDASKRNGKHYKIVSDILSDVSKLDPYTAIKIDLAIVGEKKAALRAALLRVAKKRRVGLATSSDEKHLYVFRALPKATRRDPGC